MFKMVEHPIVCRQTPSTLYHWKSHILAATKSTMSYCGFSSVYLFAGILPRSLCSLQIMGELFDFQGAVSMFLFERFLLGDLYSNKNWALHPDQVMRKALNLETVRTSRGINSVRVGGEREGNPKDAQTISLPKAQIMWA